MVGWKGLVIHSPSRFTNILHSYAFVLFQVQDLPISFIAPNLKMTEDIHDVLLKHKVSSGKR